jgi:hypothetical protein
MFFLPPLVLHKSDGALKYQKLSFKGRARVLFSIRANGAACGGWGYFMRKRPLVSALSLGCAVLVASPSWAATIEPGYGELTINQGPGFTPVTNRTSANVGDSVMVGPAGSATIVYDDGCRVPVQPGAVATVAPLSPCASGSYAADMAVKALPPATETAPAGYGEFNYAWIVLLGGFAFVGCEIAGSCIQNGETTTFKPASHE